MMAEKIKTKGVPNAIDIHVGQRLRIRRSLLGLSQEKLADAIGLTFQQIQKYERGTNRISAGRLYHFSKIMEVPITYFYDQIIGEQANTPQALSDNKQDKFLSGDMMQSKETLDLVRIYYSIEDENMRKDIVKFIKSMAERMSDND